MGLALVLGASISRAAQQPDAALILGRVIDATTGQAVPSVVVTLQRQNLRAVESALTGVDGQFAFFNLSAGDFTIRAVKTGYTDGAYGRRRPGGSTTSLHLTAGERAGGIVIRMWRPAAISGRVLDDAGRPVAGASVLIHTGSLRQPSGPDPDHVTWSTSVQTNGLGEYRFAHLSAGEYVLAVMCPRTNVPIPASAGVATPNAGTPDMTIDGTGQRFVMIRGPRSMDASRVFVTTYYADVIRPTEASTIVVGAGEETRGADIHLAARRTVQLAGKVTGPDGPVEAAMVRLWPAGVQPERRALEKFQPLAAAITAGDGSFFFKDAPADELLVDVYRPEPAPFRGIRIGPGGMPMWAPSDVMSIDRDGWYASAPLTLERNTDDLQLTMTPPVRSGGTVSGTLVVDPPMRLNNGSPIPPFYLSLAGSDGAGGGTRLNAAATSQFSMSDIPSGQYELYAGALLEGFQIVAATSGGRDLLSAPIEIGSGGLNDLRVTIGNRLNVVTGTVAGADGTPVRDAGIALFPLAERGWTMIQPRSPRVIYQRATSATYTLSGMPDGEYYLAAVDDGLMADWPRSVLLRSIAQRATRIEVHGGTSHTQRLTLLTSLK